LQEDAAKDIKKKNQKTGIGREELPADTCFWWAAGMKRVGK
jgi:hypothetical protein